jgi:hypothetical protein
VGGAADLRATEERSQFVTAYQQGGIEGINLEQFAPTAGGADLTKEDYITPMACGSKRASWGGANAASALALGSIALHGMAPGEKLEKWTKRYGNCAAKGLAERMERDRAELRERASARAHFASIGAA